MARTPDLIISDYHLEEGQTGIEPSAQLRERIGAPIPAFLISGDIRPSACARPGERPSPAAQAGQPDGTARHDVTAL